MSTAKKRRVDSPPITRSKMDTIKTKDPEKEFQEKLNALNVDLNRHTSRKDILANLDLFVLDNSIRESTVGQLRGHTTSDKWEIFEEVKRVGFEYIIVESFNHMNRVGEDFIVQLKTKEKDMSKFFAFSELFEKVEDRVPDLDHFPIGLEKMITFGIQNVVMEFDLVRYDINYEKFTIEKLCNLLSERFKWIRENLSKDSLIFANIRDFTFCMRNNPGRLLYLVNYLSSLPENERIFGIAYEDGGTTMPEEMAAWTAFVRREMDTCGWQSGHLIVHVHEQWGMCDVVQLESLANGATGIWAGLCEEGAMMGHASSCLTILNLIRMGNEKVLNKFNCPQLRKASRAVTEITTGKPPHSKQPVAGDRALDVVFGLHAQKEENFILTQFLGEEPVLRISTLATEEMILNKLKQTFGPDEQFTKEIASNMQKQMQKDLKTEIKEEYNSTYGLAMLFGRSGGQLTETMSNATAIFDENSEKSAHVKHLLADIKEKWDEWDIKDGNKDDEIDFLAFYNGFLGKYFGCYTCHDTRRALKAIDMDKDGRVDWNEFALYLNWAAYEYPETETADDLISIAFHKGLIPDMQDIILKEDEKETANAVSAANAVNAVNAVVVMPLFHNGTLSEGNIKANTINTEDDIVTDIEDGILREDNIKDNAIDIDAIDIEVDTTTDIQDGISREENTIANTLVNPGVTMPLLIEDDILTEDNTIKTLIEGDILRETNVKVNTVSTEVDTATYSEDVIGDECRS